MSIEIKIHEPPVTFGMLPVGAVVSIPSREDQSAFAKMPYLQHNNAVWMTGVLAGQPCYITDHSEVRVLYLPPGAELARPKARMVRTETLPVKATYLLDGVVFIRNNSGSVSGHFCAARIDDGTATVHGPQLSVQPCRVEVHVWPEVEA